MNITPTALISDQTPLRDEVAGFLFMLACFILVALACEIVHATVRHARGGNQHIPILRALALAVGEVFVRRPLALHRSRMAVVRRCEERRQAQQHAYVHVPLHGSHPTQVTADITTGHAVKPVAGGSTHATGGTVIALRPRAQVNSDNHGGDAA